MTRRRLYDFDKQGKVKSTVLIDKSAGGVLTYEYNASSGRYENRQTMTMPTSRSETITGTYEIRGKSIYLDFPDYTVRATIYGDSMKGVLTYKSTNEKEEWIVSKTLRSITSSNENQPSPSSSSNQASVKRIMEKFHPTRLTTPLAAGELNTENSNKRAWYIFMVAPGELTVTLTVEPAPRSSFNSVQFALYDMDERLLVHGFTMAVYGRPSQAVEKVRIADRKAVLLRLDFDNLGPGKYQIQLGGAFDNGSISEDKPKASTVSRDKTDSGTQQALKYLLEGNRSLEQKRYLKAIENYTMAISLDPENTEQVAYQAYSRRGNAKLELKEYQEALADFDQVVRLYSAWQAERKAKNIEGVGSGAAVMGGIAGPLNNRGIAKDRLGDKVGACEDFRAACYLSMAVACENSKKVCK